MRTFLLLLAVTTLGCSGPAKCVPNQTESCFCTNGYQGAQTCRADGTYTTCTCDTNVGGGAGGGDAGTTGGGSGGGGEANDPKRIFVTHLTYAPTVVTTICQTVADAASLGGSWKPWLSSSNSGSAIDLVTTPGPFKALDGTVLFANHAALATAPAVPISLTETMSTLAAPDDGLVWTGTLTGGLGAPAASRCGGDWSDNSINSNGRVGSALDADHWTDLRDDTCAASHHVYCIEQ